MWFSIGLLSLCLVLAWQVRYRWHLPWKGGESGKRDGVTYQYQWRSYKESTFGVDIAVAVPDWFRFELKRESRVDRFFKWLGLSVEKQFGHEGFDRLVYVASNDGHLLNRVADSPELRTAAQRLMVLAEADCRVKYVYCANGVLRAYLRRGSLFGNKSDRRRLNQAIASALPLLERIGQALRASQQPVLPARRRDPFLLPGVLLLATSSALALNGLLFLLRPVVFDDAFLLDTGRIAELALWVGSFIICSLLAAHFVLLARSARAHLYLLELLLVGSFGAYSTAASELREANMEWDYSVPVIREATVLDKSVHRSRRGGNRYYLHVKDWRDTTGRRRIRVSRGYYESMELGRVLVF
ncbi:hypothetical protein [Hydrogenophaga sp.]|uniref:hypothetical protein n=1 Tax=Hydrogenophaga sp. TaxID=1904254 RepID=UPI002631C493|nr:hypothetical protein [Hydrogenophaga sp.]MCW5652362.1 hypothetical protein [Hydrogenophaga sp.]